MENKLIGYCECCGIEIYSNDIYAIIDGEYYCDYCGGEDGLSISELKEFDDKLKEIGVNYDKEISNNRMV